jgi:hypothetical protein
MKGFEKETVLKQNGKLLFNGKELDIHSCAALFREVKAERLNGFDDNHTLIHNISSNKRAFLMGNALVTGIVRDFGCSLDKLLARLDGINAKSLDAKSSKKKLNKLKKNYSEV